MITEKQEQQLNTLKEQVAGRINGKRLTHTCGVEREITALSRLFAPEEEYRLRASALLHDITKQLSLEKQLQLCDEFGIIYTSGEKLMPKTFHARTAVEVIKRDFPGFDDEYILSAVRYHTTGRANMTIGEKLLYLADYIEDTRTFEDCVKLRDYFYSSLARTDSERGRQTVLCDTLILSFDMTIRGLIDDGTPVHCDTFEARNYLIGERELEKEQ